MSGCDYDIVVTERDITLRWTLDPEKAEANRREHGLGFETAVLVFDDPLATTRGDPYSDEERWRTMGMAGEVVVMVVHTWPVEGDGRGEAVGRIISARKATRRERKAYEEGR